MSWNLERAEVTRARATRAAAKWRARNPHATDHIDRIWRMARTAFARRRLEALALALMGAYE